MYNIALTTDLENYIDSINSDFQTNETTEHSFQSPLQQLLKTIINYGTHKVSDSLYSDTLYSLDLQTLDKIAKLLDVDVKNL